MKGIPAIEIKLSRIVVNSDTDHYGGKNLITGKDYPKVEVPKWTLVIRYEELLSPNIGSLPINWGILD